MTNRISRISANILVVDDERNIRLLVATTLQSEGHNVEEAPDGAAAMDLVRRGDIDLMILDLNMPVLDGMGVLGKLRTEQLSHRPKVIVLTAHGSVGAAVKATRMGALDFLEKPVTPEDLRNTVADVLRQPEAAVESIPLEGGYEGVLHRIRRSLRESDVTTAESLLMKAADLGQNDAAYFNLLGVLFELRKQWRLAKKFYGKAIRAECNYSSAQQNMRRIYELYTFGKTRLPVALGDEPGDAWFNKLRTQSQTGAQK